MKKLTFALVLLFTALLIGTAQGTEYELRYDYNTDGTAEFSVDQNGNIVTTGTLTVGSTSILTGATTQTGVATFTAAPVITAGYSDGYVFIGCDAAHGATGTWTNTRVAAGNYALVKTATDQSSTLSINISDHIFNRASATKGCQIKSIDYVYGIVTKALDAHTVKLYKTTYASGSAVSVAEMGGTLTYTGGALQKAVGAQPYTTVITMATPTFLGTGDNACVIEFTIDASDTSVYSFYGIGVNFTWYPL